MKVCFPVQQNKGIESTVYNHFGSAPHFVLVDSETSEVSAIQNRDEHHVHGACNPLKALDGRQIDAVVVGGIGGGALGKLQQAGIKVYRAQSESIRANLSLLASDSLPQFTLQTTCGGHGHGAGCAH